MVAASWSEKGVRLAQKTQAGPCVSVGTQRWKAGVGPTSGPTRRRSHLIGREAGLLRRGDGQPALGEHRAERERDRGGQRWVLAVGVEVRQPQQDGAVVVGGVVVRQREQLDVGRQRLG